MSPTGTKCARSLNLSPVRKFRSLGSFSAATDVLGADQQRDERPRVLFLNRSYWPDVEATGQLLSSLCEGLSERFRIEVLAGQPNAIIGSADSAELSESATWREVTEHQGVRIHRVSHTGFRKRVLRDFLVADARISWESSVRAQQTGPTVWAQSFTDPPLDPQ